MVLDANGFAIKSREQILTELRQRVLTSPVLNPNGRVNLGSDSVLGVLINIFADKYSDSYQLMQSVYASQYVQSAEGVSLENLVALNGVIRRPAISSTVTLQAGGVDGTSITAGSIVRDPNRTNITWIVTNTAVISGGSATLNASCTTTGPIAANTNTITEIVTPIAGWSSITNTQDATIGLLLETDDELRIRFNDMLTASGSATLGSIRTAITQVFGVSEVSVYENFTNSVNEFGVSPHSIEAVVLGGDSDEIAQAIYDKRAAGIGTYSYNNNFGNALDHNNQVVPVFFSRPAVVESFIYVELISSVSSSVDLLNLIRTNLVSHGNSSRVGATVIRSRFIKELYKIPEVLNIRRLAISRTSQPNAASPDAVFSQDIQLAFRERALFDSTRCVVSIVTV
jgi:uncharacterized phage protein gp47/JayE